MPIKFDDRCLMQAIGKLWILYKKNMFSNSTKICRADWQRKNIYQKAHVFKR